MPSRAMPAQPDVSPESLVGAVRAIPLFAELPREVLARLVGELEEVEVAAGQIVVEQGGPGEA